MTEHAVAPTLEIAPGDDLTDLVFDNAARRPDAAALARRSSGVDGSPDGDWRDVSAAEFRDEVVTVAKGLIAAGIGAGDRIGLMSKTRYEWTLFDFAIWCAGAVSVPIYETSSPEQVRWILGDSAAAGCIVETAAHADVVDRARTQVPEGLAALREVWGIEDGAVAALVAAGAGVPDEEVARRRSALGADSLATILYTSGTTGRPKGCELTHRNLLSEARTAVAHVREVFEDDDASTVLFIPLAHVLARAVQLMCIAGGVKLAHSSNLKDLSGDFASYRPTFLLAVPRVFQKVYNGAEQKAQAAGKGKIFARAAETAVAYSRALDGGRPGLRLRVAHAVFDRLVYAKLRAALGGRVHYAISGGAPLGERLGHFFRGIGLTVLEGWGLTETSAAAHVNIPSTVRMGTVGRPLPGVSTRIADDGEILVKGDIVFRRYFNNPAATAEAFDGDGWFRTGDLGELDAEGFLRITGRKKEILVTAGGKNVAPNVLEDQLRAHPLISQAMIVGDGQPYVASLITLDVEAAPGWLQARDLPVRPVAELVNDATVRAEIQRAVDAVNATVSRPESIRRFSILAVDWTEEAGHLTPKQSLKRAVVLKEFADEVDALYS